MLTRQQIDRMLCSNPSCDHTAAGHPMVFTAKCHRSAPFRVVYRNGALEVSCAACGEPVAAVAVAES